MKKDKRRPTPPARKNGDILGKLAIICEPRYKAVTSKDLWHYWTICTCSNIEERNQQQLIAARQCTLCAKKTKRKRVHKPTKQLVSAAGQYNKSTGKIVKTPEELGIPNFLTLKLKRE